LKGKLAGGHYPDAMLIPQTACAFLLVALSLVTAPAQEPLSVITALNAALSHSDKPALASLFAADADLRTSRKILATGPEAIAEALAGHAVWSETTPPRIVKASVRLLSPEVALVDADQIRYGSMIGKQSVPVILLLKRTAADWRIVSMRFVQ